MLSNLFLSGATRKALGRGKFLICLEKSAFPESRSLVMLYKTLVIPNSESLGPNCHSVRKFGANEMCFELEVIYI